MSRNKKHYRHGDANYGFRKENKAMEKDTQNKENQNPEAPEDMVVTDDMNPTPAQEEQADAAMAENAEEAEDEVTKLTKEVEDLKAQLEKEKKEYMFLMADFDNYRKHSLKDKSELIKNAGENVFKGLLPIVDDMERAIKHSENSDDAKAMYDGMVLIYKKLKDYMEKNGVKAMESTGEPFDAEKHEAIAAVPVPDEEQKGKVIDTVTTGYTINDKVLRHAKVAVGQ